MTAATQATDQVTSPPSTSGERMRAIVQRHTGTADRRRIAETDILGGTGLPPPSPPDRKLDTFSLGRRSSATGQSLGIIYETLDPGAVFEFPTCDRETRRCPAGLSSRA
jgi:hypothetical protein